MATSWEQVQEWLDAPEGTNIEFKEANNKYSFDTLVEYCVALANEGGGKVILGVTDKRPRRIVGTKAFPEPGHTESSLYIRLSHRIPVEEVRSPEGKRILIVHVMSRLPGAPWQIEGRYLKREGESLVPMNHSALKAILDETGPDFSAEICPGVGLGDLSPEAIERFRKRWAQKSGDERKLQWTDEHILTDSELMVEGEITYAALILFGTRETLGRKLAQAELVFEYRSSEASGPAADRKEFREGFFLWQDIIWEQINLRNDRQSYQDGLFRMDLLTFDEISVREALLNAVAHRDYRQGGSVFVRQYSHRLEVVSPGSFPQGITQENILDQQNPRNRRLAEAFGKCGLIERSGQGMNLMFESAIRQGKALPSFDGTSEHDVRLTLHGTVTSPAFVRYMEQLGDEKLQSFSTYDFLVLDLLRREKAIPASLKERLPGLVKAGAVESVGRGRYMLTRGLYAALGSKGDYTRKKGLDRETNKHLLLKHIRDGGDAGAQMSEFMQVLPALKRTEIQVLVRELRAEGLIRKEGEKRGSRWLPNLEAGNGDPERESP